MVKLSNTLNLARCPHCAVAKPNMSAVHQVETQTSLGTNRRVWGIYKCATCGGIVSAAAQNGGADVLEVYPSARGVDAAIPEKPRAFLEQAYDCLHAPTAAVLLAASAIDAMLKLKGLTDGTLNSRIKKASETHVITADMADWAHDVRLDANDQRHADDAANLPTAEDAGRAVEFASALAEILFVLPSRVRKGIQSAKAQNAIHS